MITRKHYDSSRKNEYSTNPIKTVKVGYTPAVLKEFGSGWLIEYYVYHPEKMEMVRLREKMERIRKRLGSDTATRKYAAKVCAEINRKLSAGWNPFKATATNRGYTKLSDAISLYRKLKEKELRPDTFRTYDSQLKLFSEWLGKMKMKDLYVLSFNIEMADDYLNYVYLKKDVSSRTYNNYLVFLRTFWNWLVEKSYADKNPFSSIRKKKQRDKMRALIPPEWDKRIIEYSRSHCPNLELVCGLVFNSFLRPAEICRLKIRDIYLEKSAIKVSAENAKNGHQRWAILTPHLMEILQKLEIHKLNPNWHLISHNLQPGPYSIDTRRLDKHWYKMRQRLKMPKEYQLYSYRDTGITYLQEKGVPEYMIIALTGHEDIEMLKKYTHAPKFEALLVSAEYSPNLGER